ncbi:uncharacterized protein TNCV_220071 [Trichonephila clavipes]|nr:uncharacterized protein TNCV_220071 [Trichonephila clavipes]
MKRVIQHRIDNAWQESWKLQTNNKLHCVKPVIGALPVMPMQRTDVKLTRLRIGHTRFTHRLLLLDDPDFVTNILVTAVSERKLNEEFENAERLKQLQYEESGKIRGHELELAKFKATTPVSDAGKISMTSLYDKLESYLRALETLGVTTEKCASILYPMVESCFQKDFLKPWNRSATSRASTDAKERLTNLMTFLKAETEGEERINLAMAGFGLGVDENRQSFKKVRDFTMKNIPSAANLLITALKVVKKECDFCTGKHSSRDCFQVQKMSLAERHTIL